MLRSFNEIIMSIHHHRVSFFNNSSLFKCKGPIMVNCIMFHYLIQLSEADHDLYWALGCCFVCRVGNHCSKQCPAFPNGLKPFCSMLKDPNGMLLFHLSLMPLMNHHLELDDYPP